MVHCAVECRSDGGANLGWKEKTTVRLYSAPQIFFFFLPTLCTVGGFLLAAWIKPSCFLITPFIPAPYVLHNEYKYWLTDVRAVIDYSTEHHFENDQNIPLRAVWTDSETVLKCFLTEGQQSANMSKEGVDGKNKKIKDFPDISEWFSSLSSSHFHLLTEPSSPTWEQRAPLSMWSSPSPKAPRDLLSKGTFWTLIPSNIKTRWLLPWLQF